MKNQLKMVLGSLAIAAALAGAPLVAAHAVESKQLELKDGTQVKVEGENVFVIAADGSSTPAPDGAHVTKDGETITTKGGKIVK